MNCGDRKSDKAKSSLIERIRQKIISGVKIEFNYYYLTPEPTSINFTDQIRRSKRKLYKLSDECYNLLNIIDMDSIISNDTFVHAYITKIKIPLNENEAIVLVQKKDYGKGEIIPIVWKKGFWGYVMNNKYLSKLFINDEAKSELIIKRKIVSNSKFMYWSNDNYLDFNLSCEEFNEIYELVQDEHMEQDNLQHNKYLERKKEEEKQKDNMLNKIISGI